MKYQFSAGALIRREVRSGLDYLDVSFIERKGLLESIFTCEVTPGQATQIQDWINRINRINRINGGN